MRSGLVNVDGFRQGSKFICGRKTSANLRQGRKDPEDHPSALHKCQVLRDRRPRLADVIVSGLGKYNDSKHSRHPAYHPDVCNFFIVRLLLAVPLAKVFTL